MIERVPSFRTADGQTFEALAAAQEHDLVLLLEEELRDGPISPVTFASILVKRKEEAMDILTTTPSSLPKARKVNGGTKKRTPKTVPATAPETA